MDSPSEIPAAEPESPPATPLPPPPRIRVTFEDVSPGAWYYEAVSFAAANELFLGIGNNLFAPHATMTRAMFLAVLARVDGETVTAFDDSGENITREEMAVIFADYLAARNFAPAAANVPPFYDFNEASPEARDAIGAMRRYGIIAGVGGNRYNPRAEATRAEVAQIFKNLVLAIGGAN